MPALKTTITADHLENLLKNAYLDGFDDGRGTPAKDPVSDPTDAMAEEAYPESVTADMADLLKTRMREGKPI